MINYSFPSQEMVLPSITGLHQHWHFVLFPSLFQSPFLSLFKCLLLDDSTLNPLNTLGLITSEAQ